MIMPFVRLFAIYLLVGLAVFAFFKRDRIAQLFTQPETGVTLPPVPVMVPAAPQPARAAVVAVPATAAVAPLTPPVAAAPSTSGATIPAGGGLAAGLQAARQAYWRGDLAGAEEQYKALLAAFPAEVDVRGELGNLYYSRGRYDEAAVYYGEIGDIALRAKNMTLALSMMGVLQQIAPQKAADLRARFDAAQGN